MNIDNYKTLKKWVEKNSKDKKTALRILKEQRSNKQ